MIAVKTFDATGVAPNGKLFAGDLNAIQAAAAGAADLTQTIDLGSLRIGETGLVLSRIGSLSAQLSGDLTVTKMLKGLEGVVAGTYTTTQRDAIPAGRRPYGILIQNSTTNQLEQNKGTDAVPAWSAVGGSGTVIGLLSARPAANAVLAGTRYFATDQLVDYVSNGTTWTRIGVPAGATMAWFANSAAPTGWVKYDGVVLPSSVGIYADLAAHLGGVATPNTKGRVIVGQDTGDTDWDVILETRGAKTHTLTIAEMPAHNHQADLSNTAQSIAQTFLSGTFGNVQGQTTTYNTGGGGAHNNIQPSIVGIYIAKL